MTIEQMGSLCCKGPATREIKAVNYLESFNFLNEPFEDPEDLGGSTFFTEEGLESYKEHVKMLNKRNLQLNLKTMLSRY